MSKSVLIGDGQEPYGSDAAADICLFYLVAPADRRLGIRAARRLLFSAIVRASLTLRTTVAGSSISIVQVNRITNHPSRTSSFCRSRSFSNADESWWCERPSISITTLRPGKAMSK